MKFLALVIPAVAIQSSEKSGFASLTLESSKDVEKMRDEFRSMAARGEINDVTKDLVRNWIHQLETDLGADIKSDFDAADQNMLDAQLKIEDCQDDRIQTHDETVDIPGLKTTAGDAKTSHATCQGHRLTECTAACDKCDELDGRIASWSNPIEPRRFEWCSGDSSSVNTWVFHLNEFLDDNAEYYFLTKAECSRLTTICNNRTSECNGKQETFETDVCTWLTEVDSMCSSYDECYKCGVENFHKVEKEALCIFDLANVQKKSLEQCLCYGELILNETVDMSVCDDRAFTPWTVPNYPYHDEIYCSERERDGTNPFPWIEHNWVLRPCEQFFEIEHYYQPPSIDWLVPTSKTPIQECKVCHDNRPYPFHLVARGACRSDTLDETRGGNTYQRLGNPQSAVLTAEQCVDACRETTGCTMVSWHTNTHDCWMDYDLDDVVWSEGTGWSCYTERYADAFAVRQKKGISEDEYETLGSLLQQTGTTPFTECLNGAPEDCF